MTDDTIRCWLVERTYSDRNLITLVYATPEGDRYLRKEKSMAALRSSGDITAAIDVAADRLESVTDADTRDRYRTEVSRLAADHDPDDAV